jgi:hypothetical protein
LSFENLTLFGHEIDNEQCHVETESVARVADAIQEPFPGCPPAEARGSRRVGRTAEGKTLHKSAVTAAAIAALRQTYTRYDELLMSGFDRVDARDAVREAVDRVLDIWRNRHD